MTKLKKSLLFVFLFQLVFQSLSAQESCSQLFLEKVRSVEAIIADRNDPLPARSGVTKALAKFAVDNNLPYKWIEVGPPERRVKRLFVAIDYNNRALVEKYMAQFNLDTAIDKSTAGTLALEFGKESMDGAQGYVTAVLRPGQNYNDKIYRWGRPDITYQDWFYSWIIPYSNRPEHSETGIYAFGHLIELNQAEQANVKHYLKYSNVDDYNPIVGKCKSDNCVAWTSGIELGKSEVDATEAQRKHLFNELGVARAMAHFEIGRRLIHAANDRHSAIMVFVNGEKGMETFSNRIEKHLTPEPKIPYATILKNVKIVSPATEVISQIPDGSKIFFPIAAGASPDAFNALIDHAQNSQKGYDVHVLVNGIGANDFRKGVESAAGRLRIHALFLGGNLRELFSENKVSVIPGNLSDFTRLMRDPNQTLFHYDTMIVRVSKPNRYGHYSLGPNNDMIMTILKHRPDIKIIAEVNPNVPFTTGQNFLTAKQIHSKFESTTALAGPAAVPANAIDAAIGDNIGALVKSSSYLQIGIGNIFSGVPDGLAKHGKSKIKVHTEMFGDPMMEMIKRGIVTSAITGFAYGSTGLYKWLHRNEAVEFKETEYVNAPGRIAQLKNFHAVNTALQVNLYGEVNATMGPNGRISSPGGQVEFMTGAARSIGGKAIIAIRSTAKNESLSSIVLNLYEGPITTPHESVTHVVTEYGIAELAGRSMSQRAVNLIKIAHPKFRKELAYHALDRRLISNADLAELGL